MAINANVSVWYTAYMYRKEKTVVERIAPKRKVIKEPKSTRVIERPRVIVDIKDFKPIKLGSNEEEEVLKSENW